MTPEHRRALAAVADHLSGHRFALGGSAMLWAHGIPVDVGDLDIVTVTEAHAVLDPPPWPTPGPVARVEPFWSDWLLRFEVGGVMVDCIGALRVRMADRIVEFPVNPVGTIVVEGRKIPLADPAEWYHVYCAYRPDRAETIAAVLGSDAIDAAARRLGVLPDTG